MSEATYAPVDLDLDAERPASFRMQGEVFRLAQLSYRAFAAADRQFMDRLAFINEAADRDEAELKAKVEEAEAAGETYDPEDDDIANERQNQRWAEQLDAFADFVAANIVADDVPKFTGMREREQHGIQQRDMHTLRRWLWEAQLGRPLASGEASSPGPGSNGASSRVESGSAAVARPS